MNPYSLCSDFRGEGDEEDLVTHIAAKKAPTRAAPKVLSSVTTDAIARTVWK